MIVYSASLGGFIVDDQLWLNGLPADSVEVEQSDYNALMVEQSRGFDIAPDATGHPVAVERPAPSLDELKVQAGSVRRDLLLEAALQVSPLQDAVDLGIATVAQVEALTEWKLYRVALSQIEQQPSYPSDISWPKAPS